MRVSIYAEIDQGGSQSDPNPPGSTALECLRACEANLREAMINRDIAERYWAEGGRGNFLWEKDMNKPDQIRCDKYGNKLYSKDGAVLHDDRARAIAEVHHWREMAEWWRERAAEDPNRVRVWKPMEAA